MTKLFNFLAIGTAALAMTACTHGTPPPDQALYQLPQPTYVNWQAPYGYDYRSVNYGGDYRYSHGYGYGYGYGYPAGYYYGWSGNAYAPLTYGYAPTYTVAPMYGTTIPYAYYR